MDKVTIKCKNYGSLLSFSEKHKDGWTTEIIGIGITARIKVSDHLGNLYSFFSDIAVHWKGWEGIKGYESREGVGPPSDRLGNSFIWVACPSLSGVLWLSG